MNRLATISVVLGLLWPGIAGAQVTDAGLYAPSVWDLKLGSHASELPQDEFIDFACGTNGGPPSLPLAGWKDFKKCRPAAGTGYRELYFQYDDQPEYWARARNLENQIALHQYTSAYAIPVIVSALFDDDGFIVGFRLVSDPRVDLRMRELGSSLGGYLMARYGAREWNCEDLPRLEGEREYVGVFLKKKCTQVGGDLDLLIEIHQFRKTGQFAINPRDGTPTDGQFESTTYFQATLHGDIPDRKERIGSLVGPAPPTDKELLIRRVANCPGCDLRGVNLKRANLAGANLSGANLTEANLHGAILTGANLSGANLEHANVNRAEVRRANLRGAILAGAMLYEARLDGADLTDANLTEAMAGKVEMSGAKANNANLSKADLRAARLNDAIFSGANLSATLMMDAQLTRSNLVGAKLVQSVLWRASVVGADLSSADARACDFYGANLREANLAGADLSYARLTGANLSSVQTGGTKFSNAELPAGFQPR